MKLAIVKQSFSSGAWRLVNAETGETLSMPERVELRDGTVTTFDGPVCGDTKAECVDKALVFAGMLVDRVIELLKAKEGE